jgi:uncharacterized protein (TIGR02284 family)
MEHVAFQSVNGRAIATLNLKRRRELGERMNNKEVITILNDLLEICRDAQEGFRAAAENIRNSEFRRLFNIFSQQRAQFVSELEAEVHRMGGNPEPKGQTQRRGFISQNDEGSIIAQRQMGDESAVNHYRRALTRDLPLDVQYVVKRQYMDIKDAYDRIRILQRAA